MHAVDMLIYGHQTVADAIKGLPQANWERSGVCGTWSVKEIMAHLASYELEDFLVYMFYAHKREHAAQINVYRDWLNELAQMDARLLAGEL